jgi:hypothetical protein
MKIHEMRLARVLYLRVNEEAEPRIGGWHGAIRHMRLAPFVQIKNREEEM